MPVLPSTFVLSFPKYTNVPIKLNQNVVNIVIILNMIINIIYKRDLMFYGFAAYIYTNFENTYMHK